MNYCFDQLTCMCFLFSLRSKLHTYDDVVERVAHQLGLDDPSKIRLTSHNCYSQQPKPQPIRYRGVEHLLDMLVHYNQVKFPFFVYPLSILLHLQIVNMTLICATFYFYAPFTDFWYLVLRGSGHSTARIAVFENT